MSTVQDVPSTPSAPPTDGEARLYQFSAEVFRRMLDAEVFADEDRVELWDGQVVEKMAKSKPHAFSSARTMYTLVGVAPPGWCVWPENPVNLDQTRLPLPDYAFLRGQLDDYLGREIHAANVGLIVELSDSSLRYDTTAKLSGYARAGIPTYWVVNLVDNVVLVFERPDIAEGRYEVIQTIAVGQAVPLRLDGVLVAEIPAVDLLPVPR